MQRIFRHWIPIAMLLLHWVPIHGQGEDHNWTTGTVNIEFPGGGDAFFSPTPIDLEPSFWDEIDRIQEGVATISNANGDLLYYSNGENLYQVIGGTHSIVNSMAPLLGHRSCTQGATILPRPGNANCNDYVLITNDARGEGFMNGINYHYFDGTGITGPGIIPPNFPSRLLDENGNPEDFHEGITVVPHPNCVDYWLITHSAFGDKFLVYLLGENGVEDGFGNPNQPFWVGNRGFFIPNSFVRNSGGHIKSSRDGDRIAMASIGPGIQILDFNNLTGELSNEHILTPPTPVAGTSDLFFYGAEFSRNGNYVYFSRVGGGGATVTRGMIFGYDLTVLPLTPTLLPGILEDPIDRYGALQRGPDGNIYFTNKETVLGLGTRLGRIDGTDVGLPVYDPDFIDFPAINNIPLGSRGLNFGLPAIYDYPEPELAASDNDTCDLKVEFCELNMRCEGPSAIELVYSWDFGDGTPIVSTTNPCVNHNFPAFGDYEVIVFVDDPRFCTTLSDTVDVSINTCCPALPDWEFLENTLITEDTYWDGKVLIGANAVVSVAPGVTLDVTNTDVLFDVCGRILLQNGATLRANNSVFRPCVSNHVWRGIVFQGNADGVINECTFKNAVTALAFQGPNTSVRIANNLFADCKAGIVMDQVGFTEGITGNTFYTEDSDFQYDCFQCFEELPSWLDMVPGLLGGNMGHIGIAARSSDIMGKISQNDFINVQDQTADLNALKTVSGIFMRGCSAEITANHFSGMRTSVFHAEVFGPSTIATLIENNLIEVNLGNTTANDQIVLLAVNNTQVLGNTLTNSQPGQPIIGPGFLGQAAGIRSLFSSGIRINSNSVSGFRFGIQLGNSQNQSITENTIEKGSEIGILVENSSNIRIGCNTIDMELTLNNNPIQQVGIRIGQTSLDTIVVGNIDIVSNCIFETDTAISLGRDFAPVNFERITNNYLFNFRDAGVYTDGYDVFLGTGSTFPVAGRNTFIGIDGAGVDMFAEVGSSITSWENFGNGSFTGLVNINGLNNFQSAASCGQQIQLVQGQILDEELCDRFWEDNTPIFPAKANAETLPGIRKLIESEIQGTEEDPALVDLLARNWESISDTADLKELDRLAQSDHSLATLASVIINRELLWYPISYPSQRIAVPAERDLISLEDKAITLYPNPVSDYLTVKFRHSNLQNGQLDVYDAMGRRIDRLHTTLTAGTINLDVSELTPGVYFIKITGQGDVQLTERFVIQ